MRLRHKLKIFVKGLERISHPSFNSLGLIKSGPLALLQLSNFSISSVSDSEISIWFNTFNGGSNTGREAWLSSILKPIYNWSCAFYDPARSACIFSLRAKFL